MRGMQKLHKYSLKQVKPWLEINTSLLTLIVGKRKLTQPRVCPSCLLVHILKLNFRITHPLRISADEGDCNKTATVVSEKNTASGFRASAVLTDSIEDVMGSSNYWRGEDYNEAGFVIDVGCKSFLKEIYIRRPYWD